LEKSPLPSIASAFSGEHSTMLRAKLDNINEIKKFKK